jgi:hypothetical protein
MVVSSEPVAGDRVADRQREEAEPDDNQDDIQHRMLLAARSAPITETALFREAALS